MQAKNEIGCLGRIMGTDIRRQQLERTTDERTLCAKETEEVIHGQGTIPSDE